MVSTRATPHQESADNAQSESFRSPAQPTAREVNADEEETELARTLEELQREERLTQMRRRVTEWQARKASGFPEDSPSTLTIPETADATRGSRRGSANSTGIRRDRDEDDDDAQSGRAEKAPKRHERDNPVKLPDPAKYRARSFREYTTFIRSCELWFDSLPNTYRSDHKKENFIKAWSEGETLDTIYRRMESADRTLTWEEQKSLLQSLLAPEEQRTQDAAIAYYGAKQRKDQSVSAFVTYVEGLEKLLPEVPESNKVVHLKQALRSDLAVEVLANPIQATTRQGLIADAQRAEQVCGMRSRASREERLPFRGDSAARAARTTGVSGSTPRAEQTPRRWTVNNAPSRPPPPSANHMPITPRTTAPGTATAGGARDKSRDACKYCGKLGHWEKDCWKKNGGKPDPAKA